MDKKIFLFLGFFCVAVGSTHAVDLTKVDFKYLYDPAELFTVQVNNACQSDTVKLLISVQFRDKDKKKLLTKANFLGQSSFGATNHDELAPLNMVSDTTRRKIFMEADLLVLADYQYLVLELIAQGKSYYYPIEINKAQHFPCPSFLARSLKTNRGITGMAAKSLDTLGLQNMSGDNSWVVYEYTSSFPSALPPMVTTRPEVSKTFEIDNISSTTQLPLGVPNSLYFIQTDTTGNSGISFLSVKRTFPKSASPDELIEPLIYICTKSEYDKLNTARKARTAFEDFWLNRARPEQAKKAIKQYYQNVRLANQLFTSYKIGWKTDQGIIMTVYGPPNQVNRSANQESWLYFRPEGTLTYTFDKVPNLFSRFHYNLQRKKEYYKDWFKEVARWRKGRI